MKKIIILLLCCGLIIAVCFIRNDLRVDKIFLFDCTGINRLPQ